MNVEEHVGDEAPGFVQQGIVYMQGKVIDHESEGRVGEWGAEECKQPKYAGDEEHGYVNDHQMVNRIFLFQPVFNVRFECRSVHTGKLRKKNARRPFPQPIFHFWERNG